MTQSTIETVDAAHGRVIITPVYSGADLTAAVLIQRTEDLGVTWVNVRADLADGVLSMLGGSQRTFPDYEAPFDIPIQYRTIKSDVNGNVIGTQFNLSATLVLPSTAGCVWWFHPVDDPTVLSSLVAAADGGATYGANRGVQFGVNARYPSVQFGARQGRSGASFNVVARTNVEAARVVSALGAPAVICVRSPSTHGWARRYVAIGNITETHPNPVYGGGWVYKAAYVEVARPSVALTVYGATYDQLAAAYLTYGALQGAYGTFDDQTLGLL